jgi:hypothetical protein
VANELLTDSIIAKEALMIVENNLTLTKLIARRYEKKFGVNGEKIGDSLSIRLPVRHVGRTGEEMDTQDVQERSIVLKIDQLIGQDLSFSNVDLTLKVDQFRERYLDTACASISNRIDKAFAEEYANCPNFAGSPGVVPSALDSYFDASVVLSNYGVPTNNRSMVVSPRMEVTIINALKGLFQAAAAIARQYETASMGKVIGFDWYMDQNITTHTVGALGGTPLVNGAGQSGSTIITDGWTAAAAVRLKRGDPITFSSVNGVNPQSRESTSELRQVAVLQDTASDGAGNMTIPIFPALELAGAYQNVDAGPADNAVIKIFGNASTFASVSTKQGLAIHKEWMTGAFVDLDLPKGMAMAARARSEKLPLSIRIVKGYDIRTNKELCRLDVLFGKKQMYEDFACRICS